MKHRTLVSPIVGLLLAGPAIAAENTARDWAAGCLSCHSGSGTVLPTLHGQPRDALISKLRAFREGTQPGTVILREDQPTNPKAIDTTLPLVYDRR